jgi:hypothetical protein
MMMTIITASVDEQLYSKKMSVLPAFQSARTLHAPLFSLASVFTCRANHASAHPPAFRSLKLASACNLR